jgi:pyruvate/2-oxoacid:ferredoxin oxidoreductase alpha subunit
MKAGTAGAGSKVLLSGSQAAAHAVKAARAEVISTYPIVPQSQIAEQLLNFCSTGELRARYVKVESAHSALSTLIGASATGARTFTATSSQGLALMHEMLHWAAGDRLPIVIANVNRALGAPWSIWVDHNDSLSQRDTGWIQFYVSSCQEVFDTILQAYKLGETVQLPVMVNLDGFYLSHTIEPMILLSQTEVDAFLPPYKAEWRLNPEKPCSLGNLTSPDYYLEFRYKIQEAMDTAKVVANEVYREFESHFGRLYSSLDCYELEDATTVFITYSTMAQTVKHAVREMRREGEKVGLIRIRMFRPFPTEDLRQLVKSNCRYIVLDRNVSFGAGGIFGQEIRAALHSRALDFGIVSITLGLGGRDVAPAMIREIAAKYSKGETLTGDHYWEGVRS